MKVTTRGNEINQYAEVVGEQIKTHVFDMGKYKGKICTLRIDFKQNGQVIRATSESGGDPALCRMAISAVYSSVFPAMSDFQYAEFKTFTLDLKPWVKMFQVIAYRKQSLLTTWLTPMFLPSKAMLRSHYRPYSTTGRRRNK